MHKQAVKFYTEEDFPKWGIEPHPGKHKQSGSVLPKEVVLIYLTNIILCPSFSSHLSLGYGRYVKFFKPDRGSNGYLDLQL
ncbi:MAG: hypothetical protein ACRDE2_04100 [Chitinophagaceae bacterium]